MSRPATAANPTTITGARYAARCTDQPSASAVTTTSATTTTAAAGMRSERTGQGYASTVETETNYSSGDDYLVEFLGYSFSFNAEDFKQRVTAAAVKLGLLSRNELDEDETADLVELVERAGIEEPRSALGDRKSTRLNSSHTVISYAVFCLKKKNKQERRLTD